MLPYNFITAKLNNVLHRNLWSIILLTFILIIVSACSHYSHYINEPHPSTVTAFLNDDDSSLGHLCKQTEQEVLSKFKQLSNLPLSSVNIDNLLRPLHEIERELDNMLGYAHLYSEVHPKPKIRDAGADCTRNLSSLYNEIYLSNRLYQRLSRIATPEASDTARYLSNILRDMQNHGAAHDRATQAKLKKIQNKLTELTHTFSQNIREDRRTLEATEEALIGLPDDFVTTRPLSKDGKRVLSTDYTDYLPVMRFADNDKLRKNFYQLFLNRGYPDNQQVLKNILKQRFELAKLLGYSDYASFDTVDKMVGSAANASDFINRLNQLAEPRAKKDYAQLLKIQDGEEEIPGWRRAYLNEQAKLANFSLDSREVRAYFSYAKVKQGIFNIMEKLFGITIRPFQTKVWNPGVQAFEVIDKGQVIGKFYLDMHPRDGKYKHAAHFGIQRGIQGVQLPIAVLVCNFAGGNDPNELLSHDDVGTFLHEFGHLMHHIFSGKQRWIGLSGISAERDFIEAPSQMLEQWAWDTQTLQSFATNHQGQVIPAELVAKMNSARDFGIGLWVRQQLFYSSLSLEFHRQNPYQFELLELMKQLQNDFSPYPYASGTHFYASFGHLAHYTAHYYTYLWSLVISDDLFSRFLDEGLYNKNTGQAYRETILDPGSSVPASTMIENFLARPYNFDAFNKRLDEP